MKLFTKEIDKKLAAQYHLGADLNAQVVVAKIFNPYGNGRWYLINSDPSDPDYLWAIVQIGDIVEVGSVSRKELENLRVGRLRFPLERDLGFSQRNAQEVYNGVVMGKTYAKGGMADVTPTYAAGGEISPETLTKFAEDLQQAESEAYDNLDIRSGGQLYRTPSLQKQYASAMNQAFAELTKKHAHLKDINVENGQTIYDYLEDQNYHSLNNYLALRGIFGTKYKQKYEGYHTKYPDNYLDPANMVGAQSYAVGGLTPGRWYKDNQGVEYKFIGKIDNGPNKDQLLFTDGTQKMYKPLDDFGEKPKENKLFGWFGDGGEIFKYVQNTFKDENGVVHIDAYTTSEDDDDEDYDEDEGNIVAYVFPDGRVAYLDARAKYDKNVQKVIKESGGNDVIEDLFEIEEYLPEEVQSILKKYQEGLIEGDYDVLKKAKKELESVGFTFDYGLGGGAFDLQVVDDLDSMSYMADGGKIKVGDVVGNTIEGFDWKVTNIGGDYIEVENLVTKKKKKTFIENMYHPKNKMADGGKTYEKFGYHVINQNTTLKDGTKVFVTEGTYRYPNTDGVPVPGIYYGVKYPNGEFGYESKDNIIFSTLRSMADGGKLNIGTIKKTDTSVLFDKQSGKFYANVIDGLGNRINKLNVNTIDDLFQDYPTFRLNTTGEKEFPESMAKGGEVSVKVGDKVKSKSGIEGEVYESTGMFFKLQDKYGNKGKKFYSTRDFKPSEIKIMADGGYNDPILIAMRANQGKAKLQSVKGNQNQGKISMLLKERARIEREMEQEAELEGGPKADTYATMLIKIDQDIKKLKNKMAMGGTTKFADKVKSIQASLLKRKKVAPSVQKDYGKTYNKSEAKEAATRITGAMTAKERLMDKKKMAKGGTIKDEYDKLKSIEYHAKNSFYRARDTDKWYVSVGNSYLSKWEKQVAKLKKLDGFEANYEFSDALA